MTDIEYWVMGGAFAVCGVSFFCVVAPMYALRHARAGTPPPMPVVHQRRTAPAPTDSTARV